MDQKEASMVLSWIWYSSNLICVFHSLATALGLNNSLGKKIILNHKLRKILHICSINLSFEAVLVSMNNRTENGKAVTLDSRKVICVLVDFRIKGQAMKLF